ncbi:MAG TPA: flavodoxin domain-containing protein [Mycobacteriales bacterium]|nr:flavodoxin domain-containing protein [Mycobacteriales bacterium]
MLGGVRVLVVYGSTRGGTAGLAHMVADAFVRHQIRSDVRRTGEVRTLSNEYDAVLVGGALYSNRWHPDATTFVTRHRAQLRQLPVWFFSSGPLDDSARDGSLAPVPQVSSLARDIDIRGHMTFGGMLDKRPSGLFGMFAWGPEGDFRDRHQVAEWVARIAADLTADNESMVRVVGTDGRTVTAPDRPPPVVIVAPRPDPEIEPEPAELVIELPDDPADSPRGRDRFGLRRYLSLDDEESDDEGLDLFMQATDQ